MALSIFTSLCNHDDYPSPELSHHPKLKLYTHYTVTPHPSPLQPLAATVLLSVSKDLSIPGVSYKWNPDCPFWSGLFHLAYCLPGLSILQCASVSFLQKADYYCFVRVERLCFSSRLSVDAWVVSTLPTVNNAAVASGHSYLLKCLLSTLLSMCSEMETPGLYDNSMFNFWRNLQTFSIEAAPTYVPTNNAQGSNFSTYLPTLVAFWLFGNSCHTGCEVASHCGFDRTFLRKSDAERLSQCLLLIHVSSLEKCLFKSFAQFWIGLFVLLMLSFRRSLYIVYQPLIRYIICKYVLHFCRLLFYLVDSIQPSKIYIYKV